MWFSFLPNQLRSVRWPALQTTFNLRLASISNHAPAFIVATPDKTTTTQAHETSSQAAKPSIDIIRHSASATIVADLVEAMPSSFSSTATARQPMHPVSDSAAGYKEKNKSTLPTTTSSIVAIPQLTPKTPNTQPTQPQAPITTKTGPILQFDVRLLVWTCCLPKIAPQHTYIKSLARHLMTLTSPYPQDDDDIIKDMARGIYIANPYDTLAACAESRHAAFQDIKRLILDNQMFSRFMAEDVGGRARRLEVSEYDGSFIFWGPDIEARYPKGYHLEGILFPNRGARKPRTYEEAVAGKMSTAFDEAMSEDNIEMNKLDTSNDTGANDEEQPQLPDYEKDGNISDNESVPQEPDMNEFFRDQGNGHMTWWSDDSDEEVEDGITPSQVILGLIGRKRSHKNTENAATPQTAKRANIDWASENEEEDIFGMAGKNRKIKRARDNDAEMDQPSSKRLRKMYSGSGDRQKGSSKGAESFAVVDGVGFSRYITGTGRSYEDAGKSQSQRPVEESTGTMRTEWTYPSDMEVVGYEVISCRHLTWESPILGRVRGPNKATFVNFRKASIAQHWTPTNSTKYTQILPQLKDLLRTKRAREDATDEDAHDQSNETDSGQTQKTKRPRINWSQAQHRGKGGRQTTTLQHYYDLRDNTI